MLLRTLEQFDDGSRTTFTDEPHTGRPRSARTMELIDPINALVHEDPRLSSRDIVLEVGSDQSSLLRILKEELHL